MLWLEILAPLAAALVPIVLARFGVKVPGLPQRADPGDPKPDIIDEGLDLLKRLRAGRRKITVSDAIATVGGLVERHKARRLDDIVRQREALEALAARPPDVVPFAPPKA